MSAGEQPVLDFALLDEIFSERSAALDVLRRALERARSLAETLDDAARGGRWPVVGEKAHEMAGMCANIGATRLSATARRFETAARDGGDANLDGLLGDLSRELSAFAQALQENEESAESTSTDS
ncbi:MAG: Hpt domain-containing protein [Candidatus Eremiobacteraeota bacterium]|nr:Hpt domain-containing protein [Candidatus Eremiobacteraeota bacterium]MBV8354906.1 Hpt domain-containing protein [Candidatus Eremiobacteraeota bacterium]